MHELGTILKSMSDGTVRLMHSRSMTKHEMLANVTIIASAGNNPIKFAPDGTAALQQMLGKRFSGFMQPIAAIEDAFDDLSAHQLGLLAGARRAALELIEQLNPNRQWQSTNSRCRKAYCPSSGKPNCGANISGNTRKSRTIRRLARLIERPGKVSKKRTYLYRPWSMSTFVVSSGMQIEYASLSRQGGRKTMRMPVVIVSLTQALLPPMGPVAAGERLHLKRPSDAGGVQFGTGLRYRQYKKLMAQVARRCVTDKA